MTELIWDGKYKDDKKVGPVRIALPFQTVETVNESAQQRQLTLDLFAAGRPSEWRNRLIWGDKKYVLPSLLPEFAGKINLIYIDPPFATGADFSYVATIPEDSDSEDSQDTSFVKEPNIIEQKAYRDTWGWGLDGYLQWFYETVVLLRELLMDEGSIYVHCDWRVSRYIGTVLTEVFGSDALRNEIIWHYSGWRRADNTQFSRKHDTIYHFTKSTERWTYKVISESWVPNYTLEGLAKLRILRDAGGDYFISDKGKIYLTTILSDYIANRKQSIKSDDVGQFVWADGRNTIKRYLKDVLVEGKAIDDVWTLRALTTSASERSDYPTQKPELLLERVIKASSNEGDLIFDCFCGSGTTVAVAEKLGRRWITCDLGRFAIHTTRKRLLSILGVKPFVVQNLGKYERQAWQAAEFSDPTHRANLQLRYRNFILQLYQATPMEGYTWLHGIKAGRLVHVGSVDAPIALGEVKSIVNEFWRVSGKDAGERSNGIDILGWDFAFDLNETAKQMAADANIKLVFKKIPREVLEKKAVEQGDIRFYELAALSLDVRQSKRAVELELKNFFVSPDDIPDEVQHAINHWSQWIDYWAVDWDYRDDTFHNQWQSYRIKKDPKLLLKASHTYDQCGTYTLVIKVIDILGNDTTKAVKIELQ